jgi:hypothetical protein
MHAERIWRINRWIEAYAGVVMTIVVTLDVFSGRPDPHWNLPAAQNTEFERRLAALPPAPVAQPDTPLGYRGFTVSGRPEPVQVFRGRVTAGQKTLADPGRDLERWLLDTGRNSIDSSLAGYVGSEIASGP